MIVVPLHHELDLLTAGKLNDDLTAVSSIEHMIVDLSQVTFCDSAGALPLLRARRRHVEAGGSVSVAGASELLTWLLAHCGASDLLPPAA
jgi:anti-sigma B factor antagonist